MNLYPVLVFQVSEGWAYIFVHH